jgi:undecaprenyl-diphosphatase
MSTSHFFKTHRLILAVNLLSLIFLIKFIDSVKEKGALSGLDDLILEKMPLVWNPILTKIMLVVTNIASPLSLIPLSILFYIYLVLKKRYYFDAVFIFSMIGGLVVQTVLKIIIHIPRPLDPLVLVSGWSFPSGHTTMAAIFFLLVVYSLKDLIKDNFIRALFVTCGVSIPLLVGFSRMYLAAHRLSEVVAGFLLGIFCVTFFILIFARFHKHSKYNRAKAR